MITVKDLVAYQKMTDSEESKKVDEWLKIKVFPTFKPNGGYEVPSWCTSTKLKSQLEARGFSVTTHSGHQGSFVYLIIPPQGE